MVQRQIFFKRDRIPIVLTKAFFLLSIFLSLSLSLEASSLLNEYRHNGIKEIQKKLDLELTSVEYWQEYLKDKDTTFGFIEQNLSILTCNKENSSLKLFKKSKDTNYTFQQSYDAYTGKFKGDKLKEGDLKTPHGIYRLTKKLSKVDPFYGPLAFVTSYPNTYDKYKNKNGHGIWIHGLPINQQRDEFTKGCIAINNTNIVCLDKEIDYKNTLLLINPSEVAKKIDKKVLASLLAQLYKWRFSWIYNDIQGYLAFYSDDFKRYDGMNFERFKKYKHRIFQKNESKSIIFNDITIIPYPDTDNIFQITFQEFYSSKSYTFTGKKVLMVRVDDTNNMKIFTEK